MSKRVARRRKGSRKGQLHASVGVETERDENLPGPAFFSDQEDSNQEESMPEDRSEDSDTKASESEAGDSEARESAAGEAVEEDDSASPDSTSESSPDAVDYRVRELLGIDLAQETGVLQTAAVWRRPGTGELVVMRIGEHNPKSAADELLRKDFGKEP